MRLKYLLTVALIILIGGYNTIAQDFYYYKGKKIPITVNQEKVNVVFSNADFKTSYPNARVRSRGGNQKQFHYAEVTRSNNESIGELRRRLKRDKNVLAVKPYIGSVPVSNLFYVKLKHLKDTTVLFEMAKRTQTSVLRSVKFMEYWYVLRANADAKRNSIELSNFFYETNLFAKIDPGFTLDFAPNACPSVSTFDEQWGLNNQINADIDINACAAWDMSTGCSDVILAIVDGGIDHSQPEFGSTNFTTSYDIDNQVEHSGTAFPLGIHATLMAGIIASSHNYGEIAGVAPNVSIMDLSNQWAGNNDQTPSEAMASGIMWAVMNGADVISNSWGDQGGQYYSLMHSPCLEEAFDYALDQGRNGLGCVVVFASGNHGATMDYPGTYRDEILTVGAIDSNGDRAIFADTINNSTELKSSAFGSKLDVVAPGKDIKSTIPDNTYLTDGGTSQAAPHVAGLASLIIGVTGSLTGKEVVDIIESTAQKVGGVNYQLNTSVRPNGTWNESLGYGLIDMEAALSPFVISGGNFTTSGDKTICEDELSSYTIHNVPAWADVRWFTSQHLTIESGEYSRTVEVKGATHGLGYVRAQYTNNNCGWDFVDPYDVWVDHPEEIGNEMDGPTSVTVGGIYIYDLDSEPNHFSGTFEWTIPNGFTITAGGDGYNYIQVWIQDASSGNVQVWRTNECGDDGARIKSVTVNCVTALANFTPSNINGNTNVNVTSTSQTYSVSEIIVSADIEIDAYQWMIPPGWRLGSTVSTGSNIIQSSSESVSLIPDNCSGGSIKVRGFSPCGGGITTNWSNDLSVTRSVSKPGYISGSSTVTCGSSVTYSISAVAGATSYVWAKPSSWTGSSTTTSITVTPNGSSGGKMKVKSKACGITSANKTKNVSATLVAPGVSMALIKPSTHCRYTTKTYYVSNAPSYANVTWSTSSGLSVTGGQGTSVVSIKATASGHKSVTATVSACGLSNTFSKSMWYGNPLAISDNLGGPSSVVKYSTYNYDVNAESNHSSGAFNWTVPSGFTVTAGGDGYNYIQVWPQSNAVSGYIQIWRTNSCGNGGARSKYVTVSSGSSGGGESGGGGGKFPRIDTGAETEEVEAETGAEIIEPGSFELTLSPNPTSDEVSIQFSNIIQFESYLNEFGAKEDLKVEVISLDGRRIVHSGNITTAGLDLSLKHVEKGMYIVRVSGNEISKTLKLVLR